MAYIRSLLLERSFRNAFHDMLILCNINVPYSPNIKTKQTRLDHSKRPFFMRNSYFVVRDFVSYQYVNIRIKQISFKTLTSEEHV